MGGKGVAAIEQKRRLARIFTITLNRFFVLPGKVGEHGLKRRRRHGPKQFGQMGAAINAAEQLFGFARPAGADLQTNQGLIVGCNIAANAKWPSVSFRQRIHHGQTVIHG